ncbi:MAG: hypothetical protein QGH37_09570 [Candidatus Poribacteria bacterium]|jgi:hypothetical protein|nr:hypothetical protein [Candidatus Poribacteria bacterium]MDP6994725.1 hypothetical protein [Candidatus Poribacteria bacterium]
MDFIKDVINRVTDPTISFTFLLAVFFVIFPPNNLLLRLNRKLGLDKLWTDAGAIIFFGLLTIFMIFGVTSDETFRTVITKPDNVPIVLLLYIVPFLLWVCMKQGLANDARTLNNEKPEEYSDPDDLDSQILVWPDLIYVELIALVLCSVVLIVWGVLLKAPLEEPANIADSPNPSKAPWYFLGLQEMLVYFDPWLAGVVFPTLIIVGLMAIPYIDLNKKGNGYYSFAERKAEISIFLFGWLGLWVYMVILGTFLRGPNWNFFGPFEKWDVHKVLVLNNINLSELFWVKIGNQALPQNILLRELPGFVVVGAYLLIMPALLAKTVLKSYVDKLGLVRYSVFVILLLSMAALPIKMYLRWTLNLKYLIAIPEYFLNV